MNIKRMRSRNHRGNGGGGFRQQQPNGIPLNRNHVFDSSGPEMRLRGTAQQLFDKYQQLARDASGGGDRVTAEAYYQHAEHYFRIIAAMNQAQGQPAGQQPNGQQGAYQGGQPNSNSHPVNGQGGQPHIQDIQEQPRERAEQPELAPRPEREQRERPERPERRERPERGERPSRRRQHYTEGEQAPAEQAETRVVDIGPELDAALHAAQDGEDREQREIPILTAPPEA